MTKLMTSLLALGGLALAPQAMAEMSRAQILEATRLAMAAFEVDHAQHADHFTGIKAWKSREDARVKIYLNHEGMEMEVDYHCHLGDDAALVCHAL